MPPPLQLGWQQNPASPSLHSFGDLTTEKKIWAKTSNVVNIKSLFLLFKSAEVTFLGTLAFTKNVVSGSNCSAAVTTIRNISLYRQRIIHLPVAVMPTYNDSRNQPRTDRVFRCCQHVPMNTSMGQRQRRTTMFHSITGRRSSPLACAGDWAEDWVYSSLCTGDQLLVGGERNSMTAPSAQLLSRLVKQGWRNLDSLLPSNSAPAKGLIIILRRVTGPGRKQNRILILGS